jgi:hypothetical protein
LLVGKLQTKESRLLQVGFSIKHIPSKDAENQVIDNPVSDNETVTPESDDDRAGVDLEGINLKNSLSLPPIGMSSGLSTPPLSGPQTLPSFPNERIPSVNAVFSEPQKRIIKNLNQIKHLEKYFVYFPYLRNSHGSIICRDENFETHLMGKKVVDHMVSYIKLDTKLII